MNEARLQSLKEQERLFGQMTTLPEICLAVRGAVNGAADPWPTEKVDETLVMLRSRLNTWQESSRTYTRVDNAVKEMVLATIEEVKIWRR